MRGVRVRAISSEPSVTSVHALHVLLKHVQFGCHGALVVSFFSFKPRFFSSGLWEDRKRANYSVPHSCGVWLPQLELLDWGLDCTTIEFAPECLMTLSSCLSAAA